MAHALVPCFQHLAGKVFCLYGPPGAGKGTHCNAIVQRLGVLAISSGDLFREEVQKNSALGQVIGPIMAAGEFVPREICRQVLTARLSQPDAQSCGILLDGQVRNTENLEDVDMVLSAFGKQLSGVVHLSISEAESVARITRRAQSSADSATGVRADDQEATVRKRYAVYAFTSTPDALLQTRLMILAFLFVYNSSQVCQIPQLHPSTVRCLDET